MLNDLRFALRMVRTNRWFSAAIVVTLALGIGVNTTVFTLVNAVLFKPVPLPGGERLVAVGLHNITENNRGGGVPYLDYLEYRSTNNTFANLEAAQGSQGIISEPGNPPERFNMMRVTPGMFEMLRTPPILGRGFVPADGLTGAEPVVLISHDIWQQRYAGSDAVIGRGVRINGGSATIIGVMPAEFKFPSNENLWMPLTPNEDLEKRTNRSLQLFGLLREGTSLEVASHDLAVIGGRLAAAFPDTNKDYLPRVRTFHQAYNGDEIRTVFLLMLAAVAFVLLIACANVANMLLSRAVARRREISVRAALGASRWRLVRQFLIECVLLSCLGGLLGLGLAVFGVHWFDLATRDVGKPYWVIFSMDWRAFSYFAAISILSGIIFGLVPALRATRVDLNSALKDDSPGGGSVRGQRLTGALVVLQFAFTVALLANAGVMMRSFFAVQALNSFVPAGQIFAARVQLPEGKGDRYEQPAKRLQFHEQLITQLKALPGVTHAASASHLPGLGAAQRPIEIEGQPLADPKQAPQASMVVQTPDYLPAIGLPVLLGRGFEATDGDPGKEAAVVTRAFAATHWPDKAAVGQRFRFLHNTTPGPWLTVIGVCADVVQEIRDRDAPPTIYITCRQEAWGWMSLVVRTDGVPTTLASSVRAAVQQLDEDLPLFEVGTLADALERRRWFLVVFGTLFLSFAVIGLLMAAVGIYAVVAHSTGRRTREIGIRMALGATSGGILRLVLTRGLRQLGLGVASGLALAVASTHVLSKSGLLTRVSPHDPLVFIVITALLVAIGLFACWLPARRAARIAPTEALRTS